ALGRPIRQLLLIAGGLVSGNPGRPLWRIAGIEIVSVPDVPASLGRRRENSPDHPVAESGRLPQCLRSRRKRLVGDAQVDLLIRRIVGELPPVRLPPRLPALRLAPVKAALQDLPPAVLTETHAQHFAVIEILPGQAVQRADDLTLGSPQ